MHTIELNRLYSASEVASLLGKSKMTVLRLIESGVLPARKANTTWVIGGSDLQQSLQARKQVPLIQTAELFTYK